MKDTESVKNILKRKEYIIKGKVVSVREAVSKASVKKRKKIADRQKVFVTGMGDTFSEDELKELFS